MKKLLLVSLCFLMLCVTQTFAQNKVITGTVTDADGGIPLPGVSVVVPGTSVGTQTGADGKYSLSVPTSAKSLTFSFIGYISQTAAIPASSKLSVSLSSDSKQLTEVVVTGAYGVKTTSRASVTSSQVVKSEQLNTVRQPNVNNALAGKVAGIQVRSQSAAALGRNTEVRLRGATGFSGGNGALYVVDGTILPNADDLSNDDIESITVLQGPAASAQFGSQGAYGAIVITTKRAKAGSSGIELNLGANFDKVYVLPNYQNTYAGGAAADLMRYTWKEGDPEEWKALDGKYYPDYTDDSSWGPKMVGQEYIPWYAWAPGTQYSFKTASLTPQPNNSRDFFNTGVSLNNSVAFTKATEDYNVRVSYANQNTQGLVPSTSLNKNTFNLNLNYDVNKHFSVQANVNFVGQKLNGQISDAYGSSTTGSFNSWFHRDLDMGIMKELQDLKSPDGTLVSWNHLNPGSYTADDPAYFYGGNYWYNPYAWNKLYDQTNQRDRLYGYVGLTYKINDIFNIQGRYRRNQTTTWSEEKVPYILQTSGSQTGVKNYYGTSNTYSNRENYELFLNFDKKISDFTIKGYVGTDIYNWSYKDNGANTNNGLSVPDLFTIGNSVDPASIGNGRTQEQYRAIIGNGEFGYKNFLFANVTLRNDWFSTLRPDANSVLSKSFGGSFVFSELTKGLNNWLSFGKIRGSWGQVPVALGTSTNTFGAYRTNTTFPVAQNKWGNNILQSTSDQYVDPEIKGTTTTQFEIGTDLRFLADRAGLQFTYYEGTDIDFPQSLSVNGASGFSSILTNIGKIKRSGVELTLMGKPVVSKDFTWDITFNWTRQIKNDIEEISAKYDVKRINVAGVWGNAMPYLIHQEGKRWGQIYGNGILRNADGVPILGSNGLYQNDPNVYFGSVIPDYTGGLQNSFTFAKDFTLNVNIDYQFGGKFVSLSNRWGQFSGLTAITAGNNDKGNPVRDPVADGGGVKVTGVDADNNPVTYYVDAKSYFQGLTNNNTYDPYIYDLTFIKLRELSVGYRIPVAKLGINKYIKSAKFDLAARNLLLIYAKTKDFDPSEVSALEGETAQLPGTRGIGFNLRLQF